jgi:hypothetical protein
VGRPVEHVVYEFVKAVENLQIDQPTAGSAWSVTKICEFKLNQFLIVQQILSENDEYCKTN